MRRALVHAVILAGLSGAIPGVPGGATLLAQGRPAVRDPYEPPGMDFRRDGAWRRRTADVRAERRALLRAGDFRGLNRGGQMLLRGPFAVQAVGVLGPAVTGRYVVPVVPVAYSDTPVQYPTSEFQLVLFGTSPPAGRAYTLKTYYEELSRSRITLEGVVFAPVQHAQTAAYVTDGCKGLTIPGRTTCTLSGTQNHMGQMLVGALASLSTGPGGDTVWNAFDNDGPDGLPNSGDDDGFVDFVTFLHPEVGGECTNATGIWAHRWQMRVWNNNSPYLTRTPRRNAQGAPIPGQFLQIDDYTIQSQLGGSTGCAGGAILPIGTVAHETGHAFGLPDLYDTGNLTYGIGDWSLMSFGNQVAQFSPSSYDAWSLLELGWVTVEPLETTRTITTGPRILSDTVFLARSQGTATQYLIIENRQAVGSDTAQMGPGALTRQKSPGLLLWYVDEQKLMSGLFSNTVNNGTTHGLTLLQADGRNDLRNRRNRGDMGDAYPGSSANTRFGLTTFPDARDFQGQALGFALDEIAQLPAGAMTFRFTRRAASVVATTYPDAVAVVNGLPYLRFEEIVAPGATLAISVEQQQLLGGRSRVTFLSWSNGGPRVQTLISGAVQPDTLVATVAVEHRVLALPTGPGTVTANRPGNLAEGIFLSSGLATTLTATAGQGAVFAGWIGDTATANPVLVLPMSRPYDLVATFTVPLTIPAADVRREILGIPILTLEQRDQLDLLGNRNGYFDLGDYLSFLKRMGLAPGAPPMMVRAGGGQ